MVPHPRRSLAALTLLLLATAPARAVIVFEDPGRLVVNRDGSVPAGAGYAAPPSGSGARYLGSFFGFGGIPIAPDWFLTAQHIELNHGGQVGGGNDSLVGVKIQMPDGSVHTTDAVHNDPTSDLSLYHVTTPFSADQIAPIALGNDLGRDFVVFGFGTARGGAVNVASGAFAGDKGWTWGADDRKESYGTGTTLGQYALDANGNKYLAWAFGPGGSALSTGDSGGGLFVLQDGVYKLAGINFAADGPFSLTDNKSQGFNAAIFDQSGLFTFAADGQGIQQTDKAPSNSYASAISDHLNFIHSVTGVAVPEPSSVALLVGGGLGLAALARTRRRA